VAGGEGVSAPEHVKNGEIVLNVSALATNGDAWQRGDRVPGTVRGRGRATYYVPIERVIAVYAKENGQGMAFEPARSVPISAPTASCGGARAARGLARAGLQRSGPPGEIGGPPTRPPRAPAPGQRPRLKRVK